MTAEDPSVGSLRPVETLSMKVPDHSDIAGLLYGER